MACCPAVCCWSWYVFFHCLNTLVLMLYSVVLRLLLHRHLLYISRGISHLESRRTVTLLHPRNRQYVRPSPHIQPTILTNPSSRRLRSSLPLQRETRPDVPPTNARHHHRSPRSRRNNMGRQQSTHGRHKRDDGRRWRRNGHPIHARHITRIRDLGGENRTGDVSYAVCDAVWRNDLSDYHGECV